MMSKVAAAAGAVMRRLPAGRALAGAAARRLPRTAATRSDLEGRLAAARQVFQHVNLFVAPSLSIARSYGNLGLDETKVCVSDYGFAPIAPIGRRPATHPLRIGYVGTLVWHKGVHVLLEAIRQLPESGWTLSLHGDVDVFPDYAGELRRAGVGRPVHFCGRFDRTDVAAIYSKFDVLVVPSLWLENSPLVIHEAFMAGVPVVGARIGGIADLVTHERTGWLYEPSSAAALAAVLARLIEQPERVNEMTDRLPHVKTIREDADEWEARYEALVQQKGTFQPAIAP
jgi:glycosyltransferase involved in cell wall biosynthesis